MFEVKCLGSINASTKSLDRGVCFGFVEKPVIFEVKSEVIDTPLSLRFLLKDDSSKPPVQFEVGSLKEGNQIDVVFYNVNEGGNGGLKLPSDIITVKNSKLSMHFRVDRAFKSTSYTLMYEFFEHTSGDANG